MDKQIIISISREYGSGGGYVGTLLAKKLNIKKYDGLYFKQKLIESGVDEKKFIELDEAPRGIFLGRTVGRFNNTEEDYIAHLEFNMIKELASTGESFVVVGRCSDEILSDNKNIISVFIWADDSFRIDRIMKMNNCTKSEAIRIMDDKDKKRETYHNTYSKSRWGHMKTYDLTINIAYLGIEETVDLLVDYINHKRDAISSNKIKDFLPEELGSNLEKL